MSKSPLRFFLLVFALSVPFWVLGAATENRSTGLPVNIPISAQMACCPLLAALILLHRESRFTGVWHILRSTIDHRCITRRISYIPIILIMPLVMLLSYGIMRLLGRPMPDPEIPWLAIPVFMVVFFAAAMGEEAGWMGYAFGPLRERWNAITTSLVLGTIWAVWHIVPLIQAHHAKEWIAWQCVGTIARRVLIVWLYLNTGKGVLAAVLVHATDNVSVFVFPNYGSSYDPAVTGLIVLVLAALVTWLWTPKTMAGFRFLHRPVTDQPVRA